MPRGKKVDQARPDPLWERFERKKTPCCNAGAFWREIRLWTSKPGEVAPLLAKFKACNRCRKQIGPASIFDTRLTPTALAEMERRSYDWMVLGPEGGFEPMLGAVASLTGRNVSLAKKAVDELPTEVPF